MSFASRYTERQRRALLAAYVGRRVLAPRVVEMAGAGELELDGKRVPPFEAVASSVRSMARNERERRRRDELGTLEVEAPREVVEVMRRRLVATIKRAMTDVERRQRADEPVKGEELRQIARAVRELAAIPGPLDPRPPAPGAKRDGVRVGGETRGGLAGAILASHQRGAASPSPPVELPAVAEVAAHEVRPESAGESAAAVVRAEIERRFPLGGEVESPERPPVPVVRPRVVKPVRLEHLAPPPGPRLPAEDNSSITLSERGGGRRG